jgi:predicted cupin superfamily sugar epimerase
MTAQAIIRELELQRHPEGGWYRQTFRDTQGSQRGHSTAIYYLLESGERSHWHRVTDAVEVWHHYAGAPMKLHISENGTDSTTINLGPDVLAGERPQGLVPAGWWQSEETMGEFTLVGCTVSPGFEFSSFEMAAPDWQPENA